MNPRGETDLNDTRAIWVLGTVPKTVAENVASGCLEVLVPLACDQERRADFTSVYNYKQIGRNGMYAILSLVRLPIPPLSHVFVIHSIYGVYLIFEGNFNCPILVQFHVFGPFLGHFQLTHSDNFGDTGADHVAHCRAPRAVK